MLRETLDWTVALQQALGVKAVTYRFAQWETPVMFIAKPPRETMHRIDQSHLYTPDWEELKQHTKVYISVDTFDDYHLEIEFSPAFILDNTNQDLIAFLVTEFRGKLETRTPLPPRHVPA